VGGRVTWMVSSCTLRFIRITSRKEVGPCTAVEPLADRRAVPSPRLAGATCVSRTVAAGLYALICAVIPALPSCSQHAQCHLLSSGPLQLLPHPSVSDFCSSDDSFRFQLIHRRPCLVGVAIERLLRLREGMCGRADGMLPCCAETRQQHKNLLFYFCTACCCPKGHHHEEVSAARQDRASPAILDLLGHMGVEPLLAQDGRLEQAYRGHAQQIRVKPLALFCSTASKHCRKIAGVPEAPGSLQLRFARAPGNRPGPPAGHATRYNTDEAGKPRSGHGRAREHAVRCRAIVPAEGCHRGRLPVGHRLLPEQQVS
jgi:hypothetical protein